jgi:hypothetical protein
MRPNSQLSVDTVDADNHGLAQLHVFKTEELIVHTPMAKGCKIARGLRPKLFLC